MSRSRAAARLFAAVAITAVSLLGAAPAQAATLPTGATINVIPDDGGIYTVNPTTAVGTLVGTASGNPNFAAIDVNHAGQGYAIAQDNEGEGEGSSFLYSANAVTGTLNELVEITDGGGSMRGCQGLDLSSTGIITVSCIVVQGESITSVIGTVNAATGAFTARTDFMTEDRDIVRALASNSAGTLYFFTEFGEIFILQPTGESTPVATADGRILGADFDITDQLWVTIGAEGEDAPPEVKNTLETLNVTTGALTLIAPYSSAADPFFDTVMITVWGGFLSATGSTGVDFVPIAIGAVLLLLAGIAIAVTHRITHRRHNHHHPAG